MGHISDTLARYKQGDITLDDAAGELGSMTEFPPVPQSSLKIGESGYDEQDDDGHELTAARSSGTINHAEYTKLYTAYAGARRASR